MPTPQDYLGDSQIQYQSPGIRSPGAVFKVQGLVTPLLKFIGGRVGEGWTQKTKISYLIIVMNSKFISYVGMAALFVAVY